MKAPLSVMTAYPNNIEQCMERIIKPPLHPSCWADAGTLHNFITPSPSGLAQAPDRGQSRKEHLHPGAMVVTLGTMAV